jgi:hypothetical protein
MNIVPLTIKKQLQARPNCENGLPHVNGLLVEFCEDLDGLRTIAENLQQLESKSLWSNIAPRECREYLLPPLWRIVEEYASIRLVQKVDESNRRHFRISSWWSDGDNGKCVKTNWKFTTGVRWTYAGYNWWSAYTTSSPRGKHALTYECWDDPQYIRNRLVIKLYSGNRHHLIRANIEFDKTVTLYEVGTGPIGSFRWADFNLVHDSIPAFDRHGTVKGDFRELAPLVKRMEKCLQNIVDLR